MDVVMANVSFGLERTDGPERGPNYDNEQEEIAASQSELAQRESCADSLRE